MAAKKLPAPKESKVDVLIVGAGPAGYVTMTVHPRPSKY